VSKVSTHGTLGRGNGITEIAENSVSQALTEQSGRNVYSLVPDVESEISPRVAADPESAAFMATNLQKAAETSLPSTSPFSRREATETIIVISLLPRYQGPAYQEVAFVTLVAPGPCLPRSGKARGGQSDVSFIQNGPSFNESGASLIQDDPSEHQSKRLAESG
jgi:hypothetical protein